MLHSGIRVIAMHERSRCLGSQHNQSLTDRLSSDMAAWVGVLRWPVP